MRQSFFEKYVGGERPTPFTTFDVCPLVQDWPLMDGREAVMIVVLYLVATWGLMKFMEGRKAYDLYWLRIAHNITLVLGSGYLTYGILSEAARRNFSLFCNSCSNTTDEIPMAWYIYLFYVSKIYEFLDTFIMALRKKNAQISLLHVYHHATIFLIWWLNLYYCPGGDAYFAPVCNTIVHVLMYSYYLLRTFDIPCPWKAYLTKFQMLQFVTFVIQGFVGAVTGCTGDEFRLLYSINLVYAFSLLALFYDFYRRTYSRRQAVKKQS
eukprot:CAMPEP_0119118970 /NCGR_PEP_ID=MMETSP1310-20130426/666_1 /TAXON_ID=464262 /ORGANISM="Genus nov. species nov., Strain RCC2339" /LENGTH=265 /DNA_ID=CAMNT_0007108377 /DNA_START=100 /DNA_END=897 /DNA_ORIENTATION=-